MTQLKRLNLAENRLRALPQSLAGLKSLERFNIAHNSVTNIRPLSICYFSSPFLALLILLLLFQGFAFVYVMFQSLFWLMICIPSDLFAGMKNIYSVEMQFNKLTSLPLSVANSSVQVSILEFILLELTQELYFLYCIILYNFLCFYYK